MLVLFAVIIDNNNQFVHWDLGKPAGEFLHGDIYSTGNIAESFSCLGPGQFKYRDCVPQSLQLVPGDSGNIRFGNRSRGIKRITSLDPSGNTIGKDLNICVTAFYRRPGGIEMDPSPASHAVGDNESVKITGHQIRGGNILQNNIG